MRIINCLTISSYKNVGETEFIMLTVNGEMSAKQIASGIKAQISERTSYMNSLVREEDKVRVQVEIDGLNVDLDIMEKNAESFDTIYSRMMAKRQERQDEKNRRCDEQNGDCSTCPYRDECWD